MAAKLGGKVERADRREYGFAQLEVSPPTELLAGLPSPLRVWNSHGDPVTEAPPGFRVTGRTENAVSAIENSAATTNPVGVHPEVRHTDLGRDIPRRVV